MKIGKIKIGIVLMLAMMLWIPAIADMLPGVPKYSADVEIILERQSDSGDNPILNIPRDLAFNPDESKNELWVVNRGAPYRIEYGTYKPNAGTSCYPRYRSRETPPENSKYWPSFTVINLSLIHI